MSTFARWRKAELFDLMNKLKITDVSNSTKKSDMIVLIEHYLENLSAPLDYMLISQSFKLTMRISSNLRLKVI